MAVVETIRKHYDFLQHATAGAKHYALVPDRFIDHNKPELQYADAGLDAKHIVATALAALGRDVAQTPARA